MQNLQADYTIERFIETCHEHRLKITPQRVAVYKALVRSDRHPSADMIFQTVKKDFPNISYDTVNRTLLTLAGIGMIDIVEVFGGPKRFDANRKDHHHLHCTKCGEIIDFEYREYANLSVPKEIAEKFQVTGKRVVLKGRCNMCQPKH